MTLPSMDGDVKGMKGAVDGCCSGWCNAQCSPQGFCGAQALASR